MSERSGGAYADSGVDLATSARMKSAIRAVVDTTRTSLVAAGFGSFGGAIAIPAGYRDPVLVSSVDGVGTKLHLAIEWGRPEVAGSDLVNHGIDDVAVLGARPFAFLDYIASGDLAERTVVRIVEGMAAACRVADVALIGGETAQMPDTYLPGAYDLAGTMIGVVERSALPDPTRVERGDAIVGLPSQGLHTNGYSLARRTAVRLGPDHRVGEGTLADALLAPHPSYLEQLEVAFGHPGVRVAAHITGGGLAENVPRVLPAHLGARFDVRAWSVPPVFALIAADQDVAPVEMYRVFNMGVGMAIVVADDAADDLLSALPGAFRAGEIIERRDAAVVLEGL
jgi:phosphoribosylformylglycinamidine cyclo-ligase